MSQSTTSITTFSIPLGIRAHQQAQRFRELHSHPDKAKRVYLNTLAVHAVHDYLAMMDYDCDLTQSHSYQPIQQTLMDCADVMVQKMGRLECRYCIEGETEVLVPPEVWEDRVGYIVVQFSSSLREAQILGFVASLAQPCLSLDTLSPLEDLSTLIQSVVDESPIAETVTQLQGWFQAFQDSWQTVQDSLDFFLSSSELALSYRSQEVDDDSSVPTLCRSKLVTLRHQQEVLDLSIFLGLKALPDSGTDVWVKVSQPSGESLPAQLKMSILTPDEIEVMTAQSNGTEAIQFRFSGVSGEQFRLQICLESGTWQEDFVL